MSSCIFIIICHQLMNYNAPGKFNLSFLIFSVFVFIFHFNLYFFVCLLVFFCLSSCICLCVFLYLNHHLPPADELQCTWEIQFVFFNFQCICIYISFHNLYFFVCLLVFFCLSSCICLCVFLYLNHHLPPADELTCTWEIQFVFYLNFYWIEIVCICKRTIT